MKSCFLISPLLCSATVIAASPSSSSLTNTESKVAAEQDASFSAERLRQLQPHLRQLLQEKDAFVSYDELDIQSDREAQSFCSAFLNTLNILPENMSCSCRFDFARLRVAFGCSAAYCLQNDGVGGDLGLDNSTCIEPSLEASLGISGVLESKACNEPLSVDVKLLGDVLGEPIVLPLRFALKPITNAGGFSDWRRVPSQLVITPARVPFARRDSMF